MTQPVARKPNICVARVIHESDLMLRHALPELLLAHAQPRATKHNILVLIQLSHRSQTSHTRATRKSQHHSFSLIIRVLSKQHDLCTQLMRTGNQRVIARKTRLLFQTVAFLQRYVYTPDSQRNAPFSAHGTTVRFK